MCAYIDTLTKRHRDLDRLIDTSRAASRQEELKQFKRERLRLKDRITALRHA